MYPKQIARLALVCTMQAIATPTIIEQALSYDDVLLVPQKSSVISRRDVDLSTQLTKNIRLNKPIVSSNMDSVTEGTMAIAMAQQGGIGIIHRFNTIEDQVEEVLKVKRYRNAVIEKPVTIYYQSTIGQARDLMNKYGIKGLLVVDDFGVLVGILTSRDIRFRPDESLLVEQLMTPRERMIVGNAHISISAAKELIVKHRIEKLPLVHDDGTVAGLITSKDIYIKSEFPSASIDAKGRLLVGAAIGVKDDSLIRAQALIEAGVDVLVLDIAHGHSELAINTLKSVKKAFPNIDIIAGNVATADGTRELIEAGADAIKVGVGPGSICTTRITTGSGYPQLSAVMHCAQEASKWGVPVIADGGIRYAGDITKAIAAGASTVMLGSLLAGTDESPGIPFVKDGMKYKVVRGMASFGAHLARQERTNTRQTVDFVPEGVEALTPYKGSVDDCLKLLIGGLCSGMSYCGVTSVTELCGNGIFVQITSSGLIESHPHDVRQVR
jgi:IMP dehydrogenase